MSQTPCMVEKANSERGLMYERGFIPKQSLRLYGTVYKPSLFFLFRFLFRYRLFISGGNNSGFGADLAVSVCVCVCAFPLKMSRIKGKI